MGLILGLAVFGATCWAIWHFGGPVHVPHYGPPPER